MQKIYTIDSTNNLSHRWSFFKDEFCLNGQPIKQGKLILFTTHMGKPAQLWIKTGFMRRYQCFIQDAEGGKKHDVIDLERHFGPIILTVLMFVFSNFYFAILCQLIVERWIKSPMNKKELFKKTANIALVVNILTFLTAGLADNGADFVMGSTFYYGIILIIVRLLA